MKRRPTLADYCRAATSVRRCWICRDTCPTVGASIQATGPGIDVRMPNPVRMCPRCRLALDHGLLLTARRKGRPPACPKHARQTTCDRHGCNDDRLEGGSDREGQP